MTVYEQLIDKGFAEKLTEYEFMKSAVRICNKKQHSRLSFEVYKVEKQLIEIISEVTFD